MRTSLLLPVAALTLICACSEAVAPLDDAGLIVRWEMPPSDCEASGLDQVRVVLESVSERLTRVVPCSPQEATLEGLPSGAWTLVLEGLDAGGVVRSLSSRASVLLHPGLRDDLPVQRLAPSPSQVDVSWSFANGLLCGSNNIKEVDVTIFDRFGHELARDAFPCDQGEGVLSQVPAGEHLLHVIARDPAGRVFEAVVEIDVDRGDAHRATALME